MYVDPVSGEGHPPVGAGSTRPRYYDMGRHARTAPESPGDCELRSLPCRAESRRPPAARIGSGTWASRKAPEEMSRDERLFVIRQFFMADRERCIQPVPRYRELLQRRGERVYQNRRARISDDDIRDLQGSTSTWPGWASPPVPKETSRQGVAREGARSSLKEEKTALLDAQQRIVRGSPALWRRLADRWTRRDLLDNPTSIQSCRCCADSDSARRAMPDATLPRASHIGGRPRGRWRLAIARHTEVFGVRPAGMWPAEGSVSPEAVDVFVAEGIRWIATDEGILFRSTAGTGLIGDSSTRPGPATRGPDRSPCSSRDHQLSDRVGFTYARMPGADAVTDFLAQVPSAEMEARRIGIADPIIPVVLDGENAWEHYEERARPS